MKRLIFISLWLFVVPVRAQAPGSTALDATRGVERIQRLLEQWQFSQARKLSERLLQAFPDLPAVQLEAAWVKFHLADHQGARELMERATAAFGGRMERDLRVGLIRAAARITQDFVSEESPDGQVIVYRRSGPDEILTPYLVEAVHKTLQVVGKDLGHRPDHPVRIELLPDDSALADMTGLTVQEIRTTGIIAVSKYGRLMITSPRATLKGFSWLDTVSHELIHMIISEKTKNRVPIWLHEALAKYEDSRWRSDEPLYRQGLHPVRESNLARALAEDRLIPFEQMHPSMALLPSQQAAELAFSEVYTVTAFLLDRKGYPGIRALLDRLGQGSSDMQAIREVYGLDQEAFVEAWLTWLAKQELKILEGEPTLERGVTEDGAPSRPERALGRQKEPGLRDFFHLGQLLRARNRPRASIVEYHKAVQLAGPAHLALWLLSDKLGLALLSAGREAEARRAFEAALAVNPLDLEAHLHLARLGLEEDPYRSFWHLRECLRINPLDPRVHALAFRVATGLLEQGDQRQDWAEHAGRHKRALQILRRGAPSGEQPDRLAEKQPAPGEKSATLRIHTRPWARVWLDYQDTGLTTPVHRLEVEPGVHIVGLVAGCTDQPVVVRIRVEPGQSGIIDRELCPQKPVAGKQPADPG